MKNTTNNNNAESNAELIWSALQDLQAIQEIQAVSAFLKYFQDNYISLQTAQKTTEKEDLNCIDAFSLLAHDYQFETVNDYYTYNHRLTQTQLLNIIKESAAAEVLFEELGSCLRNTLTCANLSQDKFDDISNLLDIINEQYV